MLISFEEINRVLTERTICLRGAVHIGAHDCEELPFYNAIGLSQTDVVWIDAIPSKVEQTRSRGIPNVYNAIITDKDDETIQFNVSNNVQSSSIFEFGTHSREHPQVVYVDKIHGKTVTVDTFFERNAIDPSTCDFWNFDIQGAELLALKGAAKSIHHAKALYLEVNQDELYKGCALVGDIDEFLAQYKFRRVLTHMTRHGWGDALYIVD
jgi:FkbM family methyltransferase